MKIQLMINTKKANHTMARIGLPVTNIIIINIL